MRPSRSWSRVVLVIAVSGGVLGMLEPLPMAGDADAALVCQHERKPLARLSVKACKKKETTVFDTAEASVRLDQTAQMLGTRCAADPSRRLVTVDRDVAGLMSLGYLAGSLCRTLDDDLAACAASYEMSYYGAAACAAINGKCMACYQPLELAGLCRNACQAPLACPADPARTVALSECPQATTPEACAQSYATTTGFAIPTDIIRTTSCFWNVTAIPAGCEECEPDAISRGRCANSCIAASDLPRCRLGGRSYGKCKALDGNPVACALTYELSVLGTQTCWYDAGAGECNGCDPLVESQGSAATGADGTRLTPQPCLEPATEPSATRRQPRQLVPQAADQRGELRLAVEVPVWPRHGQDAHPAGGEPSPQRPAIGRR